MSSSIVPIIIIIIIFDVFINVACYVIIAISWLQEDHRSVLDQSLPCQYLTWHALTFIEEEQHLLK